MHANIRQCKMHWCSCVDNLLFPSRHLALCSCHHLYWETFPLWSCFYNQRDLLTGNNVSNSISTLVLRKICNCCRVMLSHTQCLDTCTLWYISDIDILLYMNHILAFNMKLVISWLAVWTHPTLYWFLSSWLARLWSSPMYSAQLGTCTGWQWIWLLEVDVFSIISVLIINRRIWPVAIPTVFKASNRYTPAWTEVTFSISSRVSSSSRHSSSRMLPLWYQVTQGGGAPESSTQMVICSPSLAWMSSLIAITFGAKQRKPYWRSMSRVRCRWRS